MQIRITVEQITSNESVVLSDTKAAGEYLLEMRDDIPSKDLYGAAMDAFAVNVPMHNPEHFEFSVEVEPNEEDADAVYTRDPLCLGVSRIGE